MSSNAGYPAAGLRLKAATRIEPFGPPALLLILIAVTALFRWRLMRATPYPTGLDGGNWLAYGHAIFGEHIRSSTLVYPPVVPLMIVAGERLVGTYNAVELVAFIAAAAPAVGLYALLHSHGMAWRAAILGGFATASAGVGEAMAWGGYPQLIGLGVLPVFILSLDQFLASRRRATAISPAALMLLSLATSDFVGALTVVVGCLYLTTRYLALRRAGKGNSIPHVLIGIGLTAVVCLPISSIYLALLPGLASVERLKSSGTGNILGAILPLIAVTNDLTWFWFFGLIVALLSFGATFMTDSRLALASYSVLAPTLLLLVVVGERRFAYVVPLGILLGVAAWWKAASVAPTSISNVVDSVVVTFVVIDVVVGFQYFVFDRDYYTVLTPSVVEGLAKLQHISSRGEITAVSPTKNDWELGWWVEGVDRLPTIYGGNPIWLVMPDELRRNALANRIFDSHETVSESVELARESGNSYLFVDKSWPGYAEWNRTRSTINHGYVVYENDSVVIIATGT